MTETARKITTQRDVERPDLARKRHALGGNLYLNVESETSRQWLFIWQRNGRERQKGLGSATGAKGPKIALVDARKQADRYRAMLAEGKDPLLEERRSSTLLGSYAADYIDGIRSEFRSAKTEQNWRRTFRQHAAGIANEPVSTLSSAQILTVLRPLWFTKQETARRLRHRLERVLRAAKADGLRTGDNPATLENLGLPKHKKKGKVRHHPAMPYATVPALMETLRGYNSRTGIDPLRLLVLTATRTNETAGARWDEFDLDGKLWTIPAWRVKTGCDHKVPLTKDMLALLASLASQRKDCEERLFPACGKSTMLKALKRIPGCSGYTVHGFRSAFRDWCGNETNFAREIVEETYGHGIDDDAEKAYRRGEAIAKRRKVLEAWSGYCSR